MQILYICAIVGAFLLGGYTHLKAYKQGLELNLKLRTQEPSEITVNKPMPNIDITNLFGTQVQNAEMPPDETNRSVIIDEWLNGPKESR